MNKQIDLTGQKFGRLTVIKQDKYYIRPSGAKEKRWICKCECGNEKSLPTASLTQGLTQSCGCLHNELLTMTNKERRKYNIYNLSGDYGMGYTYNTGIPFYFDLEDYDLIKGYCWFEHYGYIKTNDDDGNICMHRLVMNCSDDKNIVDHIYHKRYDNRKSKLRICNNQENCCNSTLAKNNKTGIIGVTWHKRDQKWYSQIGYKNKSYFLGSFHNKEDAIKSRLLGEIKYFGEFAPQKYLFSKYGMEVI